MNFKISFNGLTTKQHSIFSNIIQTDALQTKYFILRASRQSGKTYLLERITAYFALSKPGLRIGFVMAQHSQTLKVFREMEAFLSKSIIKNSSSGAGDRYFEFINGSRVYFYSQLSINAIIGSTFDYLICDEVALWRLNHFNLIRPTVAAKQNAKVVIASTPRGKNDFYQLSLEGRDPATTFVHEFRMSYLDNPYYDVREIEHARKTMPDSVFRQEYMAEFIFGRGSVFGEFAKYQTLDHWISEPQPEKTYYAGIDVAGTGEDSTVLTIIDNLGDIVYIYETQETSIPLQAREILPILHQFKPHVAVECNGLGIGLADIIELNYTYMDRFWMTNERKSEMVSIFLRDLHDNKIKLPTSTLCPKLDNEMTTFMVSRTGSGKLSYGHAPGLHDDYVDSMLIANYRRISGSIAAYDIYEPEDLSDLDYKETFGY
jgi:hypothetical protein